MKGNQVLDKLKDIGAQVASRAGDAVDGLASTVKVGVESIATTASTVNDKAVRASTSQMCSILEIALQELNGRSLANRPVTLTASVTVGIASLQMQVHVDPVPAGSNGTDLIVPPEAAPPTGPSNG